MYIEHNHIFESIQPAQRERARERDRQTMGGAQSRRGVGRWGQWQLSSAETSIDWRSARPVVLDIPSGAIFSLPGKHALCSSSRATALIAAAPPPSCVLSARTSFSPLSLDSSAGKKVFISKLSRLSVHPKALVTLTRQPFCHHESGETHYRKTPLISTYVISGSAMVQVLIFGTVLTFGGYDKAEAKILQGRSLFHLVLSVDKALLCMVQRLWTYFQDTGGTYIWGVCTFGALQPTANFCKKWRVLIFGGVLIYGVLRYVQMPSFVLVVVVVVVVFVVVVFVVVVFVVVVVVVVVVVSVVLVL